MIDWIAVGEQTPEYTIGIEQSVIILILDGGEVCVGNYIEGLFEYWKGSFRNLDDSKSQETITHWAEINFP